MTKLQLRLRPDKTGSACFPFDFGPYVKVDPKPECQEGTAVAVKVLNTREEYGHLELPSGRLSKLVPGDVVIGVLGNRAALRGFAGRVPESLQEGGELHLLNTGGVLGISTATTVGLGDPIRLQVLGTPLLADKPARLADYALPPTPPNPAQTRCPVVGVVGTCMNSGKSTAASVLIRHFRQAGLRVHAGKATGVGAIKDVLSFRDNGASLALSFLDCGVPSTAYRKDVPQVFANLVKHLAFESPDIVVIELGDGLLGEYGVDDILEDNPPFHSCVVAANDVVGAVAATKRLQELGITPSVVTGPATDNIAGVQKLRSLGFPAANIMREPQEFLAAATADLPRAQ